MTKLSLNLMKLPIVFGIGILILLPLIIKSGFLLYILSLILLWSLICVSLNIIFGYAGQLSLAHGCLFGLGAYIYGLLATKLGLNFWVALPIAGLSSGLVGFLIGIPSLKLRGPYFVIITLGFNIIIESSIENWDSLTEGVNGLVGIPAPSSIPCYFFTIDFNSKISQYYLILFFLILFLIIMYLVKKSLFGSSLIAIKGDEDLCQSVGLNTMSIKVQTFTLSSILAGVAGVFYASFVGVLVPNDASFHVGFDALVFLAVGGIGSTIGTIIGPAIMILISELLQAMVEVRLLFNGLALILLIIFAPQGVSGIFSSLFVKMNRMMTGNGFKG